MKKQDLVCCFRAIHVYSPHFHFIFCDNSGLEEPRTVVLWECPVWEEDAKRKQDAFNTIQGRSHGRCCWQHGNALYSHKQKKKSQKKTNIENNTHNNKTKKNTPCIYYLVQQSTMYVAVLTTYIICKTTISHHI